MAFFVLGFEEKSLKITSYNKNKRRGMIMNKENNIIKNLENDLILSIYKLIERENSTKKFTPKIKKARTKVKTYYKYQGKANHNHKRRTNEVIFFLWS